MISVVSPELPKKETTSVVPCTSESHQQLFEIGSVIDSILPDPIAYNGVGYICCDSFDRDPNDIKVPRATLLANEDPQMETGLTAKLPFELLKTIFGFLKQQRDLINAAMVCHRWYCMINFAPDLWRQLFDTRMKSNFVRLYSSDGYEFVVGRDQCTVSGLLSLVFRNHSAYEGATLRVELPLSETILERTVQYFYFKQKYTNSTVNIPEFQIPPDNALELLKSADFMDC